jgi:hypothetical protein
MIMRNDMIDDEKGSSNCPFYGLHPHPKTFVFVDKEDDRCGLEPSYYLQCQMKSQEKDPDWKECGFNNRNNKPLLEHLAKNFSVYFNQDMEEGSSVTMRKWFEQVMKYSIDQDLESY